MKQLITIKHLLPVICLSLLFSSCKKELEEVEVAPVIAWEVHDKFLYSQRYIANLYGANDKLLVLGMNLFSTITLEAGQEEVKHYMHPFNNVSNHKHPMSSRIFGGTNGRFLYFKSVNNPVTSGSGILLDIGDVDPQFRDFRLVLSNSSESFAISENHVALVPYTYLNEQTGRHSLRYLLVKLAVEPNYFEDDKIVLKETRILTPAEEGGYVRYMRSHQGNFYVGTDWGFYRITENGEIHFQMPDQVAFTSFEHRGELYTMARHGRKQNHSLFRSMSDHGWSLDAQLGNTAEWLSYHAISNEILLASYNSQIFEVEPGIDKLNVRELDNTGLEGHAITSIAMIGDKVYIGTQSGMFSKAAEHLLTYKEEEKK